MSSSLTVIGGHSGNSITGIVTIPSAFSDVSGINGSLQSALTSLSGLVAGGTVNFENIDIAGGTGTPLGTNTTAPGLIELTNSNGFGVTSPGAANVTFNIPTGYNALVVEAPGTETINGGGNLTGFLGVFGAQSSVSFVANGSGSLFAAGAGDNIQVGGASWSVYGSDAGGSTVNSGAANALISVSGSASAPGNVVGIGGNNQSSTVISSGTGDLIEDYAGSAVVSVNAVANILVNGGSDTVYADAGSTSVNAFFNSFGGNLVFINNSTVPASVSTGFLGSAGHTTVLGGAGGGSFQGGDGGNNSLIGGTGLVTLYGGSGGSNFLSASGYGSAPASNAMFAGNGNATLVATATSGSNQFGGGTGTDVMSSAGAGQQDFFVGTLGSETITGSTTSGANNNYYFLQDSSQGGGTDVITNFVVGKDHAFINPFGGDSGVTIETIQGAVIDGKQSSLISLSDNTIIKLVGVNSTTLAPSLIGGTSF